MIFNISCIALHVTSPMPNLNSEQQLHGENTTQSKVSELKKLAIETDN